MSSLEKKKDNKWHKGWEENKKKGVGLRVGQDYH